MKMAIHSPFRAEVRGTESVPASPPRFDLSSRLVRAPGLAQPDELCVDELLLGGWIREQDEYVFDAATRRLVRAVFIIDDRQPLDVKDAVGWPRVRGDMFLEEESERVLPHASSRFCARDGSCYGQLVDGVSAERLVGIEFLQDVELLVSEGSVVGWAIRDPWRHCTGLSAQHRDLLLETLCTVDDEFVSQIEVGDAPAMARLDALIGKVGRDNDLDTYLRGIRDWIAPDWASRLD